MKNLIALSLLVSLCSCGQSSGTNSQTSQAQSNLSAEEQFALPKLNLNRSITIDSNIASIFEDMNLVSEQKNATILGDKAFYITINENVFPSYKEVVLGFYNKTKVIRAFYIDTKKAKAPLLEINDKNLSHFKLTELEEQKAERMIWGKRNLDNPETDMLDKAYVLTTEETQVQNGKEVKAESKYLMWFECQGSVTPVYDMAYSCSKYNLKFHYKLLDYALSFSK